MRKIAIIGAGQAGLQLGFGLLAKNYEVTVVSNRSPEEIRTGNVMSSQGMFDRALQLERNLGIDFFQDDTPQLLGMSFTLAGPKNTKAINWTTGFSKPGQSVDQRVKFPRWMEEFERRGGRIVYMDATVADLDRLSQENDLVVVAAGKGEISKLFERDAARSPFQTPQRALALTYVRGMTPHPDIQGVAFTAVPGVGEYFTAAALTTTGLCDMMIFEALPGGPMDCLANVTTPSEHLALSLQILERHMPWEFERCRNVELTDDRGILAGRFPPTVRRPVAKLPSGGHALGAGDVVVLCDPLMGQGSNNAATCADIYLQSILEHGDKPFDPAWMEATFERYWSVGQWPMKWTNSLLPQPFAPHILQILQAARTRKDIAGAIANGFSDPSTLFPWWVDPAAAEAKLSSVPAH